MKKKTKKEVKKVEETPTPEVLTKIAPFSGDFGRQDINSLRDKLNEVIDFLNK